MRAVSLLVGIFAIATSASPLEDGFNDIFGRAANARKCGFYAAQQIKACPTGKQFCSTFLKNFAPVITTVSVSTAHTTVTSPSGISSTTESPTTTLEYTCTPMIEGKRQAPSAFGQSCNVKQIAKTRIESACSCNGYTYNGQRPAPTTTMTVTSISGVTDTTAYTPSSTFTSILPTQTLTRFHLNPSAGGVMYQLQLHATATGYEYLVVPFNDNLGAAVFVTPGGYPEDIYAILDDGSTASLKGEDVGANHPILAACSDTDCLFDNNWFPLVGFALGSCDSRQQLVPRFKQGAQTNLAYTYICPLDDGTLRLELTGSFNRNPAATCIGDVALLLYPVES